MTNPAFGMSNPGYKELIEQITYNPLLQNSGDLEAATKIISGTAEASGTANADYNGTLTLTQPDDTRLVVNNIAQRLAVTIDSMTAGTLRARVYADAGTANRVFDLTITGTGSQINGTNFNTASGQGSLLNDGLVHTFYYFFWVNSGTAILSLVNLWEAVGWYGTSTTRGLQITHTGLAYLPVPWVTSVGGGAVTASVVLKAGTTPGAGTEFQTTWTANMPLLMVGAHHLWVESDQGTDLAYFRNFYIRMRSEV